MADRTSTLPPIAFGPVLSRRLGWSLGINNVRPKSCTFACVYCQLGPTDRASSRRVAFREPDDVVRAVLEPRRAYVTVPTRPPAEAWAHAPSATTVRLAADALRAAEVPTTCLVDEADEPFAPALDPVDDFLGIVAVHPMTEIAARGYLERSGASWSIAQQLLDQGLLVRVALDGQVYLRRAPWN